MQNPFSKEKNNQNKLEITKTKIQKLHKTKRYTSFVVLSIIVTLVIIALYLLQRINNYQPPNNLNLEYTISQGYKFNYNSNWNISVDPVYGLTLVNKEQTTISIILSKANNNDSLDKVIKDRLSALKDKYIELNNSDITNNNINFKKIKLNNKTDNNIIKPDIIESYITQNNSIYTVITLVGKDGVNTDEANSIIKTFRYT